MEVGAFGAVVSQAKPSLEGEGPSFPGQEAAHHRWPHQACVGAVTPDVLSLTNAFNISQEEYIFPCDTEKLFFFQCPYQSSK